MRRNLILFSILLLLLAAPAWAGPTVAMKTSLGEVIIELDVERAPESTANFLAYVDTGFYDGTIFHRVIDDFMIQGGGYDQALKRKATRAPIKNEADNGLLNRRGTIAMARTSAIDSATSQFFINLKDNAFLDHRGKDSRGFGYAVFGKVTDGMEVVDAIAKVPTRQANALFQNLPTTPVVIESITRIAD